MWLTHIWTTMPVLTKKKQMMATHHFFGATIFLPGLPILRSADSTPISPCLEQHRNPTSEILCCYGNSDKRQAYLTNKTKCFISTSKFHVTVHFMEQPAQFCKLMTQLSCRHSHAHLHVISILNMQYDSWVTLLSIK